MEYVCDNNRHSSLFRSDSFRYVGALGAVAFFSTILGRKFFQFESRAADMMLVPLDQLWANLGSLLLGFLDIQSALPMSGHAKALSYQGMLFLMYLAFAMLMLAAIASKCRKCGGENERTRPFWRMLLVFMGANLAILGLLDTQYGGGLVESRYYAIIYVLGLVFLADFFQRNAYFKKKYMSFVLLIIVLVMDVTSARTYLRTTNNYRDLDALAAALGRYECSNVCMFGRSLDFDTRKLIAFDSAKIYKNVWYVDSTVQEMLDLLLVKYPGRAESYIHENTIWGSYIINYLFPASIRGDEFLRSSGDMLLVTNAEHAAELPEHIRSSAQILESDLHGYIILRHHASRDGAGK